MPVISQSHLLLDRLGNSGDVVIGVEYTVTFSAFEISQESLGLIFKERVAIVGVDSGLPPIFGETVLLSFPVKAIPIPTGLGLQKVVRSMKRTVKRTSLQEDVGFNDDDELRGRIEIIPTETLGHSITAYTPQKILRG